MAKKAVETQALLDEMGKPTHQTNAELRVWLKSAAKMLQAQGQQAAFLRGLIQEAENDEPDPVLAGRMSTLVQSYDAEARILGKIAAECRNLRITCDQEDEQEAELIALAVESGYTVL